MGSRGTFRIIKNDPNSKIIVFSRQLSLFNATKELF